MRNVLVSVTLFCSIFAWFTNIVYLVDCNLTAFLCYCRLFSCF